MMGLSYRLKKVGAVRYIFDDTRAFSTYGASFRMRKLFLHYDHFHVRQSSDSETISVIIGF